MQFEQNTEYSEKDLYLIPECGILIKIIQSEGSEQNVRTLYHGNRNR